MNNKTQPDQAKSSEAGKIATGEESLQKPVILNTDLVKKTIQVGKDLLSSGKTKADAARAMYSYISTEPKEVIIAVFVDGAALTEKGAMTYWYNCRRRASKEKSTA